MIRFFLCRYWRNALRRPFVMRYYPRRRWYGCERDLRFFACFLWLEVEAYYPERTS